MLLSTQSALSRSIGGGTRLFAIIGDPVAQVRSPEVFNASFATLGVDAVLVPMHVAPTGLDDVLSGLKQIRNLDGIVITVPHKLAAIRHADHLLETARIVGAVNALTRQADGTWVGDIFDGRGFVAGLAAEGCAARGLRVHLAGAGGVGRAIAFALAREGVAQLTVYDFNDDRSRLLVEDLRARFVDLDAHISSAPPLDVDLLVNATPLGMEADDSMPFALDLLPQRVWIADAVMKPEMTRLVESAKRRGHRVMLGRRILEHQIPAILAFFGVSIGR